MTKVQKRQGSLWARVFLPFFQALLLLVTLYALATADEVKSTDQQSRDELISSAIDACREKLSHSDPTVAPYAFPKTRRRLALLLESRLPDGDAVEIANLFASSARNVTAPFCLEASERVESFLRAAEVVMKFATDQTSIIVVEEAEALLREALSVRKLEDTQENDEEISLLSQAHATVFERLIHLILKKVESPGSSSIPNKDGENLKKSLEQLLRSALRVCEETSELCPNEPVVDEYRGAIIRKLYGTRSMRRKKTEAFVVSNDGLMMRKDEGLQVFGILDPRTPAKVASGSISVPELVEAADSVYGSYASAALKSHNAAIAGALGEKLEVAQEIYTYGSLPSLDKLLVALDGRDKHELNILSQLWSRLIQHIILAAAAAREASLTTNEDQHLAYGLKILSNGPLSEILPSDIRADMLVNAGISQKSRGRSDEAIQLFHDALAVNPGDGHATVQLASLSGEGAATATSLSNDYVAGLFDGYSDRFEQELVEELGYRGHDFVADAAIRHGGIKGSKKAFTCVDLGCGTGLAGSLLRERIGSNVELNLLGVDLSTRMAEYSRARRIGNKNNDEYVYNDIYTMDGNEFLASRTEGSVDVIVSSDVFIYVGDLGETFYECARALKASGILSFTVEMPSISDLAAEHVRKHGFALLKSGRFGHSRDYIERIAKKTGFKMVEWTEKSLRKQGNEDVPGALVVLRRR